MGIYFFGDSFNVFNAFGLILAILGNILLLDKKEHKRQKNLKKGIFFLFIDCLY